MVNTRLIGVPLFPIAGTMPHHVQEDKHAIGEIFECVMEHIRTPVASPAISRSRQSQKLLKSLSVYGGGKKAVVGTLGNVHREERWKSCRY